MGILASRSGVLLASAGVISYGFRGVMTGTGEMPRHRIAHHSQTEKRAARHVALPFAFSPC